MPSRLYRGSTPPTRRDHLLAHPYELSLAVTGLTASLLILAGGIVASITVSPSVDAFHGLVAWGVGLLGIPGHALIIAGLLDNDEDLMNGWRRERTGLVLAAFAWAIYTLAILAANPGSVVTWGFGLALITAHCLRLRATQREERDTRAALARHEEH